MFLGKFKMYNEAAGVNAFELLAKPIRRVLAELGFIEPTLPQTLAFPTVLARKNVLLIAPTGSGKTEAVLLPIFSNLIQGEREKQGIRLLYITPLRALNRDMLKRLAFWSDRLGITIEVRHGDTDVKTRRKQAHHPPQILVTTPETLQAILPGSQLRRHLSQVEHVVIDEVHELASSKRGVQLTVALERLFEITGKEFQRIGLSATVGNPDAVAKFIAGANREINVVQAVLSKGFRYNVESPEPVGADYDLAGKLQTSPEAAARIRRLIELIDSHKSTLIFANSRSIAEMLGHKFSMLSRMDVAVHHGSLSKEERISIEDCFKAGTLKAIVCTSTMELGVDIGDVDLVVQYMSPRQVGSLIQRVGRSGHRLNMLSKGIVVTVYPDDTLESIASVRNAYSNMIEPVLFHEGALDVLAHQTVGVLMDKGEITVDELAKIVRRTYCYRKFTKKKLLDITLFLDNLGQLRFDYEGKILTRTRKTREYYYGNLSMIPDERRYPVINVLSDRKIGTVGDEFMSLDARVGLNFIMRGKVWRIVQIEEETGTIHVVPSEDPFAAAPGWDGEILPVSFDLAQQTGESRAEIGEMLKQIGDIESVADKLSEKLATNKSTLLETVREIDEHMKQGASLPTQNNVLVEAFDRYFIVHASFGEVVNRTLGGIFDAILSEREIITGWWADGYRILIESPRKLSPNDLERLPEMLFGLSDEAVDEAFKKYVKAKFPYAYKMKFIAERFGALPRGKAMSYERQNYLKEQFKKTPIYDETLREAMLEKADISKVKQIMYAVKEGKVKVSTVFRVEKPTPLAYHILAQFADVSELMAPERVLLSNLDKMKKTIEEKTATLLCMNCGEVMEQVKVKSLPEQPECPKCSSKLLSLSYLSQDYEQLKDALQRRKQGKQLTDDELKELSQARRKADLVLSYGKQAIVALEVKGVGPQTASRILGKMHPTQDEFYMDLLKAKIQYLRTREYWDTKNKDRAV